MYQVVTIITIEIKKWRTVYMIISDQRYSSNNSNISHPIHGHMDTYLCLKESCKKRLWWAVITGRVLHKKEWTLSYNWPAWCPEVLVYFSGDLMKITQWNSTVLCTERVLHGADLHQKLSGKLPPLTIVGNSQLNNKWFKMLFFSV